jgi:hypothetical protein
MLRKLAAAVIATTLIAAPALAADTSGTAATVPAAPAAPAAPVAATAAPAKPAAPVVAAPAGNTKQTVTPGKTASGKQSKVQTRKHLAHKAAAHQANTGTSAKRS